ncbi:hypothetical protein PN498_15220 [Oscillatoria sp. CS-180]|uniref:hypothetical protein n=1 Tax=Oscillatoria sp. CS-180 TaxID=3021720 RepID=UPI00232EE1C0|nr:hypothetical protein [Oscillatoria sp. CS-180]MDB9527349.1 hypothetical protein [Oscillatoria sp. CS-180]
MAVPVSVWILAARTDLPYLAKTIPHQMKVCDYPFVEKVLALDTAPLSGDKLTRYGTGSQSEVREACQKLVDAGVMDRIEEIDYDPALVETIYTKYFGAEQARHMRGHTHNWKGSTVYASLYCIEQAASDCYLHFDADMLLYQAPDFNWITEAVQLLKDIPEIAAMRPLCGPPHPDGKLFQKHVYRHDSRGFYAHDVFSMRAYLVDRRQFARLSPIPLSWKYQPMWSRWLPKPLQSLSAKVERRLRKNTTSVEGAIASFEPMTSQRLQETDFFRADLSSPKAWTIHPANHSAQFIEALPQLIQFIEQGLYPQEQAGHYDLKLDAWLTEAFLQGSAPNGSNYANKC